MRLNETNQKPDKQIKEIQGELLFLTVSAASLN